MRCGHRLAVWHVLLVLQTTGKLEPKRLRIDDGDGDDDDVDDDDYYDDDHHHRQTPTHHKTQPHAFLKFSRGLNRPVKRSQDTLRGLCGDDYDDDHHHQPTHQKRSHVF